MSKAPQSSDDSDESKRAREARFYREMQNLEREATRDENRQRAARARLKQGPNGSQQASQRQDNRQPAPGLPQSLSAAEARSELARRRRTGGTGRAPAPQYGPRAAVNNYIDTLPQDRSFDLPSPETAQRMDAEGNARRLGERAARDYSPLPDELGWLVPPAVVAGDALAAVNDYGRARLGDPGSQQRERERGERWSGGAEQAGQDMLDEGHGGETIEFLRGLPQAMQEAAVARQEQGPTVFQESVARALMGPMGQNYAAPVPDAIQRPVSMVADLWTGWPAAGRDARRRVAESDATADFEAREQVLNDDMPRVRYDAQPGPNVARWEHSLSPYTVEHPGLSEQIERERGDRAAGDDFWITGPAALEFIPGVGFIDDLARSGGRIGLRGAGREIPEALASRVPDLPGPMTQNAQDWRNNFLIGGAAIGGAWLLGEDALAQELPTGVEERDGLIFERAELPSYRTAVGVPRVIGGQYIVQEFANGERHVFLLDRSQPNAQPQHLGRVRGDLMGERGRQNYGRSQVGIDSDQRRLGHQNAEAFVEPPAAAEADQRQASPDESETNWREALKWPVALTLGLGTRAGLGRIGVRPVPREIIGAGAAGGAAYAMEPTPEGMSEALGVAALSPLAARTAEYVVGRGGRRLGEWAERTLEGTEPTGRVLTGPVRGYEFDPQYRVPGVGEGVESERLARGVEVQQQMARQAVEEQRGRRIGQTPEASSPADEPPVFTERVGGRERSVFGEQPAPPRPPRPPLAERSAERGAAGAMQGVLVKTMRQIADDMGIEAQGVPAAELRRRLVRELGNRFDSTREMVAFLKRYGVSAVALGVLAGSAVDGATYQETEE